jgi:arabinose-5-phosphate isomerase
MESQSVQDLAGRINADFEQAVELIYTTKGRLVVTGIGKSAIIANKIVATLNSTGSPAIFMHAADAVHGDLGMILKDDIVLCISKSGNTPEIKALIPLIKSGGNTLIGMVGNIDSYLAANSNLVLDTTVQKEACPNNLAPTTSTTAQLVMGDALAVCLLKRRNFSSNDFARYHPGGSLGKKLYTTMADIAAQNASPQVRPDATIQEVIVVMTQDRLGAVAVVEDGAVLGIITDGDIRRMLEQHGEMGSLIASDIMSENPFKMEADVLAIEGAKAMRERKISQIIVQSNNVYQGMVHIHDLNREGILI